MMVRYSKFDQRHVLQIQNIWQTLYSMKWEAHEHQIVKSQWLKANTESSKKKNPFITWLIAVILSDPTEARG